MAHLAKAKKIQMTSMPLGLDPPSKRPGCPLDEFAAVFCEKPRATKTTCLTNDIYHGIYE
jgi:hypothetical protein